MAVFDLQVFLQERLRAFDENMDVSSGSPADTQVIQPIMRRLGTDPFTVDSATFITSRLQQAFPEMSTEEGDALTDMLVKPSVLILDPFVREVFRIRNGQSFKDPTILTTDEADALGANLFSTRELGDFARGTGRVYFSQPRTVSVTPANFFTSKGGLHFFPDGKQDITVEEMLLNVDGSLYYFDINAIAEQAGTSYNIDPRELVNIANLEGTAKVTNLRRFASGNSAETAVEFAGRAQQELTERSMVTLRGIGAQIPKAFAEVTRLAVVGFGDPEMQRDVLRGGGLGNLLAGGTLGKTVLDGINKANTRRFAVDDVGIDFTALVDSNNASAYVLTVMFAFDGTPLIRDLPILKVIDSVTLDVVDQAFLPYYTQRPWTLRKQELTLSGIPGGILFPDTAAGTVSIPDNEVHVGGHYDVSVRGSSFDSSSLVLDNITDADPAAAGVSLVFVSDSVVQLNDLILGNSPGDNYAIGDDTYLALYYAQQYGYTLQILDGIAAGDYRVTAQVQLFGASPQLTISPAVTDAVAAAVSIPPGIPARWRLVDTIDIDLTEPKDTRISGTDLRTLQNSDTVSTGTAVNFAALGVSVGDTLRVFEGLSKGDYSVKSFPTFDAIKVDRALAATELGIEYSIFKANTAGGLQLPLIRISQLELLDTAGQPVGSIIPYANPVDIQSRAFENPGRGVKKDLPNATLGLVSVPITTFGLPLGLQTLVISFSDTSTSVIVTFGGTFGSMLSAQQIVDYINDQAAISIGVNTTLAVLLQYQGDYYVGLVPLDVSMYVGPCSAQPILFGGDVMYRVGDVRADGIIWNDPTLSISSDNLDVVQVLDGVQPGFYGNLNPTDTVLVSSGSGFAPELGRHIKVGSRSLGGARCYFLSPTSIEFGANSVFEVTLSSGAILKYLPDPTLGAVRVPPYPTTTYPSDGSVAASSYSFYASYNFAQESTIPGDILTLLYVPIVGTTSVASIIAGLVGKSLVVSVAGSADQVIVFGHDKANNADDVLREELVGQINTAVGKQIASLSATNYLTFIGDVSIVVRGTGTANGLLGYPLSDSPNNSFNVGDNGVYTITSVSDGALLVTPAFTYSESSVKYQISRPGTQRCSSTQMSANTSAAGLYYFDVELVSEGTGDQYNIDSNVQLHARGYRSDGYYLTTEDSNLTFSVTERPHLHVSRSILEVGVSDKPSNATQLSGQNLEVTYDRSTLTSDVQNFVLAETERVVCSNPLSRHLVPHLVRFDLEYVGGSSADIVSNDITTYVQKLFPSDFLEVGALVNIAYQRGATGVMNPIDLIAIVHNYDRTVQAQRSQNALNTGRLAAFMVDVINVNRRSS